MTFSQRKIAKKLPFFFNYSVIHHFSSKSTSLVVRWYTGLVFYSVYFFFSCLMSTICAYTIAAEQGSRRRERERERKRKKDEFTVVAILMILIKFLTDLFLFAYSYRTQVEAKEWFKHKGDHRYWIRFHSKQAAQQKK